MSVPDDEWIGEEVYTSWIVCLCRGLTHLSRVLSELLCRSLLPHKLFSLAHLFLFVLNCCVFFGGGGCYCWCVRCMFFYDTGASIAKIDWRPSSCWLVSTDAGIWSWSPHHCRQSLVSYYYHDCYASVCLCVCVCVFVCVWYVCALMHAEIYICIRLHPFFDLDEEDDLIDGCDSPIDGFGDSPVHQQYAPVHPPPTSKAI